MPSRGRTRLDEELDALFRLPLAEFTSARNALVARLKKDGRAIDAGRVKSLAKPSATAWAVNQLYWEDPRVFDALAGGAERIRKAQSGKTKNADLRALLDEKKRRMAEVLQRAAAILNAAGHAASPDAMRRVSATLEALALRGATEGVPKAGRLAADLDPPGFEAFAAGMGGGSESAKVLLFRPASPVEDPAVARARARETVQTAVKTLRQAQRAAALAEKALTKATARIATVEKQKQAIEARYAEVKEEARAAANEAKKAELAVADAEQRLDKAKAALE